MDASYLIPYVADETPDVRALHERCVEQGLATTADGETDRVAEYRTDLTLHRDEPLETALSALEGADRGTLYAWTDSGLKLGVTFSDAGRRGEFWGRARISFQTTQIEWHHGERTVAARIADLLDLVAALTPVVDPEYVWSAIHDDSEDWRSVVPTGRPIRDNLGDGIGTGDLSWITIMSGPVIEQFGGRDHVLETPAWQIRELATGHIMLVLQNHPYDPTERLDGSWKRHLLKDG